MYKEKMVEYYNVLILIYFESFIIICNFFNSNTIISRIDNYIIRIVFWISNINNGRLSMICYRKLIIYCTSIDRVDVSISIVEYFFFAIIYILIIRFIIPFFAFKYQLFCNESAAYGR